MYMQKYNSVDPSVDSSVLRINTPIMYTDNKLVQ